MRLRKIVCMITVFLLAGFMGLIIPAHAEEEEPLEILITLTKKEVSAGEAIDAEYLVLGGSGSYTVITYSWQEFTGGVWLDDGHHEAELNCDSVTFRPGRGTRIRLPTRRVGNPLAWARLYAPTREMPRKAASSSTLRVKGSSSMF